jgi:hypothetical protein
LNVADCRVDAALVVDEVSFGSNRARNAVAGDKLTWPIQRSIEKHEKNLEWLGIQLDAHSLPAQLTRCSIGFKDSKAIALCRPEVVPRVRRVYRSV